MQADSAAVGFEGLNMVDGTKINRLSEWHIVDFPFPSSISSMPSLAATFEEVVPYPFVPCKSSKTIPESVKLGKEVAGGAATGKMVVLEVECQPL